MAKSAEKIRAREMKRGGESVNVIAKRLRVSKSTASLWCQDIELSSEQIKTLDDRKYIGGYMGRMLGAQVQKERKRANIELLNSKGVKRMEHLSEEAIFMIGLGLYFGEGSKGSQFQFTNSNPALVKFIIFWLGKCFKVPKEDVYCRILINELHVLRTSLVEQQWAEILEIPLEQFRRTTLVKTINKKVYENHDTHLGTLALRVRRCTILQRKVLGLMHGLVYNIMR